MSELKPCPNPWCGGDAFAEKYAAGYWRVACEDQDECGLRGPRCDTEAEAITAWNTRTMSEWQPIATAPKDGTVVLFYTPEEGERRFQLARSDDRLARAYWLENATHWMPLTPPKGDT